MGFSGQKLAEAAGPTVLLKVDTSLVKSDGEKILATVSQNLKQTKIPVLKYNILKHTLYQALS